MSSWGAELDWGGWSGPSPTVLPLRELTGELGEWGLEIKDSEVNGGASRLGDIPVKGERTVFQSQWPFVNVGFLSQAPESLHVFEYNGQAYEMADTAFRAFRADELPSPRLRIYPTSRGGQHL